MVESLEVTALSAAPFPLLPTAYLLANHDLAALGVDDNAAQALGDGHGLKGAGEEGYREVWGGVPHNDTRSH